MNARTHGLRSQKVRIAVAFGDISGFTKFCEAVTNDAVEFNPLMDRLDKIVEKTEQATGYFFVDTGDGFMCTMDLPVRWPGEAVAAFLAQMWRILKSLESALDEHRIMSICPDGYRIVVAAGFVNRKVKKDGQILMRGKHINVANNHLDHARGHGLVAHESARVMVSDAITKKFNLAFSPLKKCLDLYVVTMNSRRAYERHIA